MSTVTQGKSSPPGLQGNAANLGYPLSSLIVSALERRFPSSAGYGTLLPRGKHGGSSDTGLIKAFSKYYVDQLFSLGALLLPWDKIPADFVNDRSTVS